MLRHEFKLRRLTRPLAIASDPEFALVASCELRIPIDLLAILNTPRRCIQPAECKLRRLLPF